MFGWHTTPTKTYVITEGKLAGRQVQPKYIRCDTHSKPFGSELLELKDFKIINDEEYLTFQDHYDLPTDQFPDEETADVFRKIREKVPLYNQTIIQRIIPDAWFNSILRKKSIAGFCARMIDVQDINGATDIIHGLGLAYPRSLFLDSFNEAKREVYAIRFLATDTEKYVIPYGGNTEKGKELIGGTTHGDPPFKGHGFAPMPITPEYRVLSDREVTLLDGAEIYHITESDEELVAVFVDKQFVRVRPY